MPDQTELPGETERARQRAADLRRNAYRIPMLFGQKYGLGKLTVGKPDQIPPSAVDGIESAMNLGKTHLPLSGQPSAIAFRQIRHLLECVGPALIHGFENLRGT